MGIIFTHQKSKPKKKPGWQQSAAEYDAWLKSVGSLSTNFSAKNRGPTKPVKKPTKVTKPVTPTPAQPLNFAPVSPDAFKGGGTKKVHRPEITYRDNPELLERELKARERKFPTAPAYNKGGAVLVTEEMMKDIASGATRRRN